MVFPLFFLYNQNAVMELPPETAAESTAEMQGEEMRIYQIGFDKWDVSRIMGQADRRGLSFPPAHTFNFITPFQGTRCVHGFSVGAARLFAF